MSAAAPASTKPQYFLSYAVLGATVPFLSVLLKDRGLTEAQIGVVLGVSSLGVIFTPVLVTVLADTRVAGRTIMGLLFALAGLFVALLVPAQAFWPVLACFALHTFCLQAIFPLQDGVHFAAQAMRTARGLPETPFQTVRVWGSIGYIVPGAILWFALGPATPDRAAGGAMTVAFYIAAACAAVGAVYALVFLPHTPPPPRDPEGGGSRLPTAAAARALMRPHVLVFCCAMFLIHLGSQTYYFGYPLHLTERAGFEQKWIGPITAIGVIIEVFVMLAFKPMLERLGLRRIMYLGALATAGRLFLLALLPDMVTAIATQIVHGFTVVIVHIAAPTFLNAHASDRYRNSMQGLYAMTFAGAGRILGAFASGWLATYGLATAFTAAGVVCTLAMVMFMFAFREPGADDRPEPRGFEVLPAEE